MSGENIFSIKNSESSKEKADNEPQLPGPKIIDDVFTDDISRFKPRFEVDHKAYVMRLWESNPDIYEILMDAADIEQARERLYTYLEKTERQLFDKNNDLHSLEKATVRECVRVFKNIIGPVNEFRTGFSALNSLFNMAKECLPEKIDVTVGFLLEFINLFRGVAGKSNIYLENSEVKKGIPDFLLESGRDAALKHTQILNEFGMTMKKYFKKYPSGLDEEVRLWRKANQKRILAYFNASPADWRNYKWHLRNVIRDAKPLFDLLELSTELRKAISKAIKNKIPFGITPYYLSLMDYRRAIGYDHAVRAQNIPSKEYVDLMVEHRSDREYMMDFMGEHDTSPEELITRRYPAIAIMKPFNTCSQICVYCQRNWEIEGVLDPKANASKEDIAKALNWLDENPTVGDILVTGGDPLIMNDHQIEKLLAALAKKKHIYRIRFGTRTPVVLPMRWTSNLINILKKYHQPPLREITIVTHFEHSYEITPETLSAVQKIKKAGLNVYNQTVYTIENSRRFEAVKLRKDLKSIGVDPYYLFNMKGKEETRRYMVPIARILQERKEEARLLPGLDRTDEPVFNVPRLGKNHLRAGQDHILVMILANGSRVYEFHPWEKNITAIPTFNYIDVPIYDYLEELAARGENIRNYRTIWYYY